MSEMERRIAHKQNVDEAIAQAQIEQGICLVLTGNGKGKTTAGIGTLVRALGWGQRVCAVQFIKGNDEAGERQLLEKLDVPVMTMNTGFSWESDAPERDRQAAMEFWCRVRPLFDDPKLDLLLLDELTYLINWGHIELEDVLEAIASRPRNMSVIITGRAAHRRLKELADTVSEIRPEKHAFNDGIKARKGVDF